MPRYNKKRKAAVDAIVKEDIYKAVNRILSKYHPRQFTMSLVAREAGIARGTLYNYFKSKSELVVYAIMRAIKSYEDRMQRIAASDMPAWDKLLAIAELDMSVPSEKRQLVSLLFQMVSRATMQKEAEKSIRQEEECITKIIESGLRQGIFRDIPASDILTAYFGIVEKFANRILADKSNRTVAEDVKIAMGIFMNGVTARQS